MTVLAWAEHPRLLHARPSGQDERAATAPAPDDTKVSRPVDAERGILGPLALALVVQRA